MSLTISKDSIKVLFSEQEIANQIAKLAAIINEDYKNTQNLVLIGVLKGAFIFVSDLARALNLPCQLEFIRLSSYQGTQRTNNFRVYDLTLPNLEDKDVLIIEDIVDSGRTAHFLLDFFTNQAKAKTVKLAALFDKPSKREAEFANIKPDYSCFEIGDIFILGYGLDFDQKFRELPYIGRIEGLV